MLKHNNITEFHVTDEITNIAMVAILMLTG